MGKNEIGGCSTYGGEERRGTYRVLGRSEGVRPL